MKSDRIRLQLTAMTQGGEAMGRDDSGRVVFVPYALAGERVVAEVVEEKKNYARARLIEIVEPSPERTAPRCPHFGPPPSAAAPADGRALARGCGGCQWQHASYDAQLRFKTAIVREQFERIGKLPDAPVAETVGMSDPWRYRNHVQFQLDGQGRLCFRALESHDLVPIQECHLLHPALDAMFQALEFEGGDLTGATLRTGIQTGEKFLLLESAEGEPPELSVDEPVSIAFQSRDGTTALIGKDALHEKLRGRTFRISPESFFQVNTEMAERLVDWVEEALEPQPADTLADLYGGVGTFGLLFAPRVARVIEIEEAAIAVSDARANAVDLENVEFRRGAVEDVLPHLSARIDLVVADPPRAGFAPRALDALIAASPRTIVYVSCDPSTLARDARRLVDRGYRLTGVRPLDLFPQTYHVESVSRFVRAE